MIRLWMLIRLQPSLSIWLLRLFPTLSSPWRRVPALSVTESGRLSAATDSRSLSSLTTAILETESCESAATETEQKRRTRGTRWASVYEEPGGGAMGEDGREGERIRIWAAQICWPPRLPQRIEIWDGTDGAWPHVEQGHGTLRFILNHISLHFNWQRGGGLKETEPISIIQNDHELAMMLKKVTSARLSFQIAAS